MQIVILLFEKLAAQDAVGPYEVFRCVPGWDVHFAGLRTGEVRSEGGLGLTVDRNLDQTAEADLVLVPGGRGSDALLEDEAVLSWLRAIDATTKWTTSVCTGALVLGAAGLLEGKRATSNWLALGDLSKYGADPIGGRWVEDGKTVTAAGVTAGIDMALHLVGREAGPEVAQAVQLGIEYDPDPPYDAGSPEKAPAAIVEAVTAFSRANAQ
ncbi:MAG TPA: DJ-1/PfpI family protein [Solirubrobacterales bacterium]|nr:DJ-1/PfpI family protein [Solirubrobacterales bacterium]